MTLTTCTTTLAAVAAALALGGPARAAGPDAGPSYDWHDHADVVRAPLRGFTRAEGDPHVLFVNFDGADISEALWDNASKNETSLTGWGGAYQPFDAEPGGPIRAAILNEVRADFAGLNLEVTDERPGGDTYEYTMIVVSPTNKQPGKLGFASVGCGGNPLGVGFAFYAASDGAGAPEVASTISHEAAHTLGLDHVTDTADLMYPNQVNNLSIFVDACAPIDGANNCAEAHEEFCPPGQQNSYQQLAAVLGEPMNPGGSDPVVTLVEPPDRSRFDIGQDILLAAEASDDIAVSQVKLYLDDQLSGTALTPPYEWTRSFDEEGLHELHALALDGEGNEGVSNTVLIAIGDAEFPPEPGTTGGDAGGEGSDGGGSDSGDITAGGSATDGAPTAGGTDSGVDEDSAGEDGGCGCRSGARPPAGLLALALLLALGRRRRRCASAPR